MNIILSSGLGPLHFVSSAQSIALLVGHLRFVCGYIPRNINSLPLKFLALLRGKKMSAAARKRTVADSRVETCQCVFAEMLNQAFMIGDRLIPGLYNRFESIAWSVYGWQSKRYVGDAEIFHVRSGAGQGGAIKLARKRGMKVLVDHSALYPSTSELNLRDDYARWGQPIAIAANVGVWKNVIADCKMADLIVVNANHIKESFVENGFEEDMIRVVHLGVRKDFWGVKQLYKSGAEFRVLFTGGFILLKGAEYILESLKLLVERGVKVRYDIVGAVGAPRKLIRKYEGLPIVYHGQVPQENLKAFLARADCYLFPSLADGCAQSGMEALSAGVPVVATRQSGLPITDGETGCVVAMKDAAAIADKIEWLVAHYEERERIGRNAARMMRECYSWEKYAENMERVYNELIAT